MAENAPPQQPKQDSGFLKQLALGLLILVATGALLIELATSPALLIAVFLIFGSLIGAGVYYRYYLTKDLKLQKEPVYVIKSKIFREMTWMGRKYPGTWDERRNVVLDSEPSIIETFCGNYHYAILYRDVEDSQYKVIFYDRISETIATGIIGKTFDAVDKQEALNEIQKHAERLESGRFITQQVTPNTIIKEIEKQSAPVSQNAK